MLTLKLNNEPTTIPLPSGSKFKYRSALYCGDKLDWSDWKTEKTTEGKNASESIASFLTDIPVFSFAKYEIIAE